MSIADFAEEILGASLMPQQRDAVEQREQGERRRPRVIVLAGDKRSGYHETRNLGIEPVAVVTPRAPYAARGKVADRIMEATSLTAKHREALLPEVLPCTYTSTYPG